MHSDPIRLVRSSVVGLILVTHARVNALSPAARLGLIETLAPFEADGGLRAVALVCDGPTFIAGAGINEFSQAREQRGPLLHVLLRALDACLNPVVTALHGTALGGGFEVALARQCRGLVRATPSACRLMRSVVDFQHLVGTGDERGVASGGITHWLCRWQLRSFC